MQLISRKNFRRVAFKATNYYLSNLTLALQNQKENASKARLNGKDANARKSLLVRRTIVNRKYTPLNVINICRPNSFLLINKKPAIIIKIEDRMPHKLIKESPPTIRNAEIRNNSHIEVMQIKKNPKGFMLSKGSRKLLEGFNNLKRNKNRIHNKLLIAIPIRKT